MGWLSANILFGYKIPYMNGLVNNTSGEREKEVTLVCIGDSTRGLAFSSQIILVVEHLDPQCHQQTLSQEYLHQYVYLLLITLIKESAHEKGS